MRPYKLLLIAMTVLTVISCTSGKKNSANKIAVTSNSGKTKFIDASYMPLREKYAKMMSVSVDSITNMKLYSFIDEWLNTPYKWGGTDKAGIDCSAFIQKLLSQVYDIN